MKTKHNLPSKIILSTGLALALGLAVWLPIASQAAEPEVKKGTEMKGMSHPMNMNQIKTQAEAEALKPGDSISMACSMCKNVMVMPVTAGTEHVKMMTVGEKHTCPSCKGTVTIVGTGKGEGKNQEVKHVCSHCGDDAMFICASKPGSGAMKDMDHGKKK
ncbi:hypothetical protein [Prosthecobacter sp.]|uniref:hypothetical protein n=1 Tax=Prosthecobacter sp. TaxID=1965333 RepID=UPI0024877BCD|nr:hypothetical protein [Prosthecobacter sp.]MDI1314875.1 hypothetical protein [Prosthecobacter sp.]